jgi:hypothetical protein
MAPGSRIRFTFYWRDAEKWEGSDFVVTIGGAQGIATAVAARDSGSGSANVPT